MYIYTVCYLYVICMLSVSIWATVNISLYSSKSSNFKGCTIVFQGLGNHVRIPYIPFYSDGFPARDETFPGSFKRSTIKRILNES